MHLVNIIIWHPPLLLVISVSDIHLLTWKKKYTTTKQSVTGDQFSFYAPRWEDRGGVSSVWFETDHAQETDASHIGQCRYVRRIKHIINSFCHEIKYKDGVTRRDAGWGAGWTWNRRKKYIQKIIFFYILYTVYSVRIHALHTNFVHIFIRVCLRAFILNFFFSWW